MTAAPARGPAPAGPPSAEPGPRQRAAGAALAVAGLLFIGAATLTPMPNAQFVLPRTCIVCGDLGGVDVTNNVLLFIPLGAGLALAGVRRWLCVLLCVVLTVTIEFLQIGVIVGRDASIGDIIMNTVGGTLGVGLVATWRRWVLPAGAAARRLAVATAAAWVAILLASGWALQRTVPPGEYEGQIVPEVDGYSLYRGYTLAATLNGRPIPRTAVRADAGLRQVLLGDSVAVDAVVTTGSAPQRLAPVAILWGAERGELFALGQRRRDLVFRMRMRTASALVRTPAAVIVDAFPFVPLWPLSERTPRDTMRVAGGVRDRALYVAATLRGRTVRREVPLAVTLGWSFFLPFEYSYGTEVPFLTALWVGGLLLPAGYWAARATRPGARSGARAGARWGALLAAAIVVGLGVLPAVWRLHPSRWWEWAAAAAGLAVGWWAGAWSMGRARAAAAAGVLAVSAVGCARPAVSHQGDPPGRVTTAASGARPDSAHGPELFGLGVFTTPAWDFFVALTPDQRTAYFCRADATFSYYTTLVSRWEGGRWSAPEVAPFSGRWSDADPHLSPDGSKLFFISNRPVAPGAVEPRGDYDVWYVERAAGGGWGEPSHVGPPVSADSATEWSPSVAASGNLYFGTVRRGGRGGNDLYVARWTGSGYAEPENLGDSINTRAGEVEPWIAPDESYLIFSAQGRADGAGGFDLYVSYRRGGVWQAARPLGGGVNSTAGDFNQSVSPDGRYLYFSSTRGFFDRVPTERLGYAELQRRLTDVGNGLGDIYRIETRALGITP